MIVIALILFVLLFLKVRTYRECLGGGTTSGGATNSRSGGGFAGRDYGAEGALDDVHNSLNPFRRLEGPFNRCSPESCPTGSGNIASTITVGGGAGISRIPHVPREPAPQNIV